LLDRTRIRNSDVNVASVFENQVWKKIWKLKVPQKIRVFWWRVVHEFLPARHILCSRHVEPIANYDVCEADEESIRHVLIECTVARAFWEHAKELTGVKLPELHPVRWARDLLCGRAS